MYNRYIRNDEGNYTRIFQAEQPPPKQPPPPKPKPSPPENEASFSLNQLLRRLLGKLHMENVDTGDLILLLLLFFLFEEKADDELLIALGLLLIL